MVARNKISHNEMQIKHLHNMQHNSPPAPLPSYTFTFLHNHISKPSSFCTFALLHLCAASPSKKPWTSSFSHLYPPTPLLSCTTIFPNLHPSAPLPFWACTLLHPAKKAMNEFIFTTPLVAHTPIANKYVFRLICTSEVSSLTAIPCQIHRIPSELRS